MKPKPNGVKRARLTACGYEQQDGLHYQSHDLSALVVNNMTIQIIFVMTIMAGWATPLFDANGAFLNSQFQNKEQLYMRVPQGLDLPRRCVAAPSTDALLFETSSHAILERAPESIFIYAL
eukprot:10068767-Ditylum_brightwellii.AAC.2